MECALYPCFDITCGKIMRNKKSKKIEWVCGKCGREKRSAGARVAEKFLLKTGAGKNLKESDKKAAESAISTLKTLEGLGEDFLVLTRADKKTAFDIESKSALSNIGIFSCLIRDVTIAFSHNSGFRPPPLPEVLLANSGSIIGEQTNHGKIFYCEKAADELVLPPIPFPEISGRNVCSGSPSPALDEWLRKKIRVKKIDATLLLGFDL